MSNKVAIVTGASRGIGNAIAVQLASDGYNISAVGTSDKNIIEDNLEVIRKAGQEVIYIKANIAIAQEREEILSKTLRHFDRVDVLVNNAGVAPKVRMDILDTTEESYDRVMNINLKGTFFLSQLIANEMVREMGNVDSYTPKIINISSVSAYTSSPQRAEYCISKAGIGMITALFADRLAEYGINVYEIRPGIIYTEMTAPVREKYEKMISEGLTPIKRWGYPEDVAKAVSVLTSGKLTFSTGEVINVDGGFHLRRL